MEDYKYPSLGCPKQLILLEYCEYEFFDIVHRYNGLSEKLAGFYFRRLVKAVKHIHDKGYCHRDIKLANCFVSSDFDIKLADFSFGCKLQPENGDDMLTGIVGTKRYMAPELYAGHQYNGDDVDTFALGVLLFCTVMHKFPFHRARRSDFYYSKLKRNPKAFWNLYDRNPSKEFKNLVESLLQYDYTKRPKLSAVLEHDWI